MSEKVMADYLSAAAADYTATELSVSPQRIIVECGQKEQVIHKFHDGQRGIVTLGDGTAYWDAMLQWDLISTADEGTIKDFFHDSDKANGMAETFYWQHPVDGNTYTVRFLSKIETVLTAGLSGHKAIKQVKLQVLGTKPT